MGNAAETSTIIDSDDFSEKEWKTRMKQRRRNKARKLYDSVSTDEDEYRHEYHHKVLQDDHHCTKKKRNESTNMLHVPSLPKPPSVSFSSQSHTTSNVSSKTLLSRSDETQRNVIISTCLLLL